jgi:hypothetical protein
VVSSEKTMRKTNNSCFSDMNLQKSILFCLSSSRRDCNSCIQYTFNVKRRRRIRQMIECGRSSSRPARRLDFCGFRTKVSNTLDVCVRGTKWTWAFLCTQTTTFLERLVPRSNALSNRSFSSISSLKITLNDYCRLTLIET